MKKRLAMALAVIGCLLLCCGCGGGSVGEDVAHTPKIVCTVFPVYDWTREIIGKTGETAEVTLLLDSGVDLHSYQPTAQDMVAISTCDVFIYVGGESDNWVKDALKSSPNENRMVINLMDILGERAREEEEAEGMEQDHEEHDHEELDHEEKEYDEHIWLSLKNAIYLCTAIEEHLERSDPANGEAYRSNLENYVGNLKALDGQYSEIVQNATQKTILFGDRFPFLYLAKDYGLSYYGAFPGCSAETEASFETIAFLAKKMDELHLPAVLTIEGTTHGIAQTIVNTTKDKNQEVLSMDSMQSVTRADGQKGITYLSVMEKNLTVLKKALG